MDERQQHLIEDLSGVFRGELRCDPLTLSIYSSDASIYEIPPMAVAFPKDRADVVTLARYAGETNIPLVPRGAGSGVAGGAIGSGVVVDFSRSMRRIEEIGESTVRLQPGVVLERLNHTLREYGRYFPPDPSNADVTTIGGMLAVDAAGSHSVRIGSMRDHVQSIEMVLGGGSTIEFTKESLSQLETPPPRRPDDPLSSPGTPPGEHVSGAETKRTIVSKLAKLLADHEDLIEERQPRLIRNCSGYYLRGVLSEDELHLPRMLVGSEGTLGMFTSATLHTAPLPAHRGVVLLLFGQLEAAAQTVRTIAAQQPSACDLLDRRLLTLAREADRRFGDLISPAAEAALIVEQTGLNEREVRDRIAAVIAAVRNVNLRTVVAREAYTFEDVEFLWSLPHRVVPHLISLKGRSRPLPFVEDVAVPPESLNEFLIRAQKVFQNHQVTASLYSHAAAGQVHLRPFLPPPGPEDGPKIEAIARDLYEAVFSVGGTISGEHGDGLARTAFIRSQYGPLYKVFQQIKDIFDPHNLMNPGKIVSDDPHVTARNFRPPPEPVAQLVDLQLQWDPQQISQEAGSCNGCGVCRTQRPDLRMCPFFHIDPREEASPRSKANVMRRYASGQLDAGEFTSPDMKRLANLCFNCKQCQLECPANVNIPQLMIEAKAAYVATHGLSRADWILSRAHSFGAFGCTFSPAMNWVLTNPGARWILEKLSGISRRRKLPLFARRSFLRAAGRDLLRSPRVRTEQETAVYFVSEYANYHDPQLARAFVSVLRYNGVRVHVPSGQTGSGMAMISAGDLDAARDVAEANVRVLAELARDGHPIVCTEPAAALCLSQEYPKLLDHPDVELVASRVVEAGAFLLDLHRKGRLRTDLAPLDLDVGYHTPCHLKALDRGTPLLELLSLIPNLRVHTIEKGCSGMAGSFGLAEQNFRTSIRIGWGLIKEMQSPDLHIGATECTSCKIQMEQGTSTPTLHPLKLLAHSYGLMPEIAKHMEAASGKLTVT